MLNALPYHPLPTLEPGRRSRISARRMPPDTKLRVFVRGVLLGRVGAARVLLATSAPSPSASKFLWKPEAFLLRGLGPPKTERVRGVPYGKRHISRTELVCGKLNILD